MQLAWYRAPDLRARSEEPPFLTLGNITVGGIYSADGPDGVGDQYFEGLSFLGETHATWLVAPHTFPATVDDFLQLPIATVRVLESDAAWATVQVEAVKPVRAFVDEAMLGEEDGIRGVHPDFLGERPLRSDIRSWPAAEPHLWLNTRGPFHPLRTPNALKAVLSLPHAQGRRLLIVTHMAETCYLVHDR